MISSRTEIATLTQPIQRFLGCPTPSEWIAAACRPENLPVLLIDHLICELKAAQSAVYILRRYVTDTQSSNKLLELLKPYEDFVYRKLDNSELLATQSFSKNELQLAPAKSQQQQIMMDKMVLLIKEELHHFRQVLELMTHYQIPYENISASRYANALLKHVRTSEPAKQIDKLICGAFIEARSCERFAALVPHVDTRLAKFYTSLLRSEARHFEDYLTLAEAVAGNNISARVALFRASEAELIQSTDTEFRFHSGLVA